MKNNLLVASAMAATLMLAGCEQEGPMERAGEDLDNAMEDVADSLEPNKGPAEKAGEALDNLGENLEEAAGR